MSDVAAIDLGATSGRVVAGGLHDGALRMETSARFPNTPVRLADGLHWDVAALWSAAMRGLGAASAGFCSVARPSERWWWPCWPLRGTRAAARLRQLNRLSCRPISVCLARCS